MADKPGGANPLFGALADVFQDAQGRGLGTRLKQVWQLVIVLWAFIVLGMILLTAGGAIAGTGWSGFGHLAAFCGFLTVLFVAAFIAGGGVGLIFGVPRIRADPPADGDTQVRQRALESNTNLERISDWLTNGIVAVALVKLDAIAQAMAQFGVFAGAQFPNVTAAPIVAQCLVVSGAVLGFIFGYIQTRTALALTFSATESVLQSLQGALENIDESRIRDPDALEAIASLRASVGQRAAAERARSRASQLRPEGDAGS